MLIFLRFLFGITLILPLFILGEGFVEWTFITHFPLMLGVIIQTITGVSIFIYIQSKEEGHPILLHIGYILFFSGLTGSYFAEKSLYLPFCWELSTLGAFIIFASGQFLSSMTKSLISLFLASGVSAILLTCWVILPQDHPWGNMFLLLGLLLKTGFSFLHIWYPDLHEGSPTTASASFSGIALNLPLLMFVHYFQPVYLGEIAYKILVPIAGMGIFFGGVTSFFTKDIKKVLAYSTIEKANFLWLCLFLYKLWIQGVDKEMDFFAEIFLVLFYLTLLHHSFSKTYQFLVFGFLKDFAGTNSIDEAKGVGRISGIPFLLLGIGTFSFALLPGTLGFISEGTYLYLISRVVDLEGSKSIVILPAMVIFIIGLALGSMAHLRLYLTLSLSVPSERIIKSTENKHISRYIIMAIGYMAVILVLFPIFLSGFLAFGGFLDMDHGLNNWFITLFTVSIITIIFYVIMVLGKLSHRIEKRVLWDCGNNYRGSELSIPASVISEPLHDSLGITTRIDDGDSTLDEWIKQKIISLLNLGKIWIGEVESGDISNYIAFSSTSLLITFVLIIFYKYYKDNSWNFLTILF